MLHFLIFIVFMAIGASVGEVTAQYVLDRWAERRRKQ